MPKKKGNDMILDGIRVIEWGLYVAAPTASAMLGDLGADVIKIEKKGEGDPVRGVMSLKGTSLGLPGGRQVMFEHQNRNKRGVAIDLKTARGREVVYRLVEKSDAFLTNYRRQKAVDIGLDYTSLKQHNPLIIYGSATGFGHRGPDSEMPVLDLAGQARSGLMSTCSETDPVAVSSALCDSVTALTLAYGIVAALLARETKGIGQEVNVSLLGSMTGVQGIPLLVNLMLGQEYRMQPRTRAKNPLYNWYKCKDSRWIVLGLAQSGRYWSAFCKALNNPVLETDSRFQSIALRERHCRQLVSILDKIFATKTSQEWAKILKEANLISSPVNSIGDLRHDPQMVENKYIIDVDDYPDQGPVKFTGFPVEFTETPAAFRLCAPEYGQHTEEVLMEVCGYSWKEIGELREQNVI